MINTDMHGNIEIYTDGGCVPNPGQGGWGYVIVKDDEAIYEDSGSANNTTNNIMELRAVIEALKYSKDYTVNIRVFSDSKYVVNGCNGWIDKWKGFGWYRNVSKTKEVVNLEVWKELDDLLASNITVKWIKGHSDHKWNDRADELCMDEIKYVNNHNSMYNI